ncbi:Do family serine endopeptidase [Chromohalobacter sp. HP20-39]|uniref:Do family serine endopeptidase n=1 Tax=Chromohalobacter sp. HP20-39 TaxID=3079306 RepID=UPI00294AC666|nr:Do family serine endopeptidase [Chromohalobacter sp. HP20-39]MDV6318908.1 Do family serine endopeptidase [Chromohalobacter sp. HP20-39]
MRRSLMSLVWPIISGILLAIVLLNAFPQLLGERTADDAATPIPDTSAVRAIAEHTDTTEHAPEVIEAAPLNRSQGPTSYATAVDKAAPAVVNIYSSRIIERSNHPMMSDPFFEQFFGKDMPQRQRMLSSLGSGVIVSPKGYVLTNNHVIRNADEIQVALRDGRETLAKVVGTDPESDLAVLKIPTDDLPVIKLSNSEKVAIGDVALAIGNPFGMGQTVTMGIISATGRDHLGLNAYEDFIQTDAAINPGNSGGALVNAKGALVGINTAIFSRSGGSQGIGFAIPANLAHKVLNQIVAHGRVIRGWLGIDVQAMTPTLAASFGLKALKGVAIVSVVPGGPGDQADLKPGDILLSLNGKTIVDAREAMADIAEISPGTKLPITIVRNGKKQQVTLTVGERPKPTQTQTQPTSSDKSASSETK